MSVKRVFVLALLLLAACSQTPVQQEAPVLSPSAPHGAAFVPGEVIVKFRAPAQQPTLRAQGAELTLVRSLGAVGSDANLYRAAVKSEAATLALVRTLSARPDVLYAHPNFLLQPSATPNDPRYAEQWHLRAINLPAAWDRTKGSSSVTVAVLDTGILPKHPDLKNNLLPGYDFVSWDAGDGDGRDGDPTDPDPWGGTHGTHVAGTVAATGNNGVGVTGVSWRARLLPVRVLGPYGGTLADVIDGILWSGGKAVSGVPKNATPAHILNLSLGGPFACTDAPALQDALSQVIAAGAAVVAAAGNDNSDARGESPASCRGVIAVGATTLQNRRAGYSNYGPRVDVMAPGGDISRDHDGNGEPDGVLSTAFDAAAAGGHGYAYYNGTSMAAPHVAGTLALMKSVRPSLTPKQALDILKRTARPISHSSCSVGCGAGLIDAAAALRALESAPLYTITFDGLARGTVVSSVRRGAGIATSSGTLSDKVAIYGQRRDRSGNVAMVTGSARHLILSQDGKRGVSYSKGGTFDFKFGGFGTGRVRVVTLKVRDVTTSGGTVKIYRGSTLLKTVAVPKTGTGSSRTLAFGVSNASLVKVTLTGPGAVDDLAFEALK